MYIKRSLLLIWGSTALNPFLLTGFFVQYQHFRSTNENIFEIDHKIKRERERLTCLLRMMFDTSYAAFRCRQQQQMLASQSVAYPNTNYCYQITEDRYKDQMLNKLEQVNIS